MGRSELGRRIASWVHTHTTAKLKVLPGSVQQDPVNKVAPGNAQGNDRILVRISDEILQTVQPKPCLLAIPAISMVIIIIIVIITDIIITIIVTSTITITVIVIVIVTTIIMIIINIILIIQALVVIALVACTILMVIFMMVVLNFIEKSAGFRRAAI